MGSPLLRQATLRLLLALAVSGGATIGAVLWLYHDIASSALRQQLGDARDYLVARTQQFERRWAADAFAVKTVIEVDRRSEDLPAGRAGLTSFFTALGSTAPFAAAVIHDREGRELFRYPPHQPSLSWSGEHPPAWHWDSATATLSRALHLPLWLGSAGMGRVTLLRPVDHALLHQTAYPGTELYLVHRGQVVASSLGSSGVATGKALLAAPSGQALLERLAWPESPGVELLVQRTAPATFVASWAVWPVVGGLLGVGALTWLLLARWVRGTARRLARVEESVRRFAADPGAPQPAPAEGDHVDEISHLAHGTRAMMQQVAEARAQQARAQATLAELNASLEQRVEQRTAELAAARDDALEAARAKEMFVANMSHELRTPMNGLLGALELLRTTPMRDDQRDLLDTAATSGEALLAVINDVLDFASLNAGKLAVLPEPGALRPLVQGALRLFSASASRRGIGLRLDCDHAVPEWVSVDGVRLRQVLLNLIGNAVKFTVQGEVAVRVVCGEGDEVVFEVADTGIGIPPEQLDTIFDAFVQLDATRQRRHGGTGLGLAISQRLARAMGGRIEVQSSVGVGSLFRLRVPLPAAAPQLSPPWPGTPPAEQAPRLAGRVLLVEDNVVNRIVGGEMLRRLGLEVLECGDGGEACVLLERERVDAVLMDLMMPGTDGLAATREIRRRERAEGRTPLPIVALTASALQADVDAAFEAGMNDHVAKPFTQDQLARALAPYVRPVSADGGGRPAA